MIFSVGILTASDKGAAGLREDHSGRWLHTAVNPLPGRVVCYAILPDEKKAISDQLCLWCDFEKVNLLLTTGGTGPAPSDVTPEATQAVIERPLPGISEMLRWQGYQKNPMAVLSRGVAGIRGKTLMINLPGSLKAVEEGWALLLPILPHALSKMLGDPSDCGIVLQNQ